MQFPRMKSFYASTTSPPTGRAPRRVGLVAAPGEDTATCPVLPGTYHVSENDPSPGALLTGLVCDDTDSTTDLVQRQATIVVGQGETVTCTFTNTIQAATIVIKKVTP
jgi:hypothetical protein